MWSERAIHRLCERNQGTSLWPPRAVFRVLLTGGTSSGFRCEGFWTNYTEDADQRGHAGGMEWVVDPVSWQFLKDAHWDCESSEDAPIATRLRGIGPGESPLSSLVLIVRKEKPAREQGEA